MKQFILALVVSLGLVPALRAELKLPAIFSDHMIFQQKQSDPVWGWDTPGTRITVTFAGQNYNTTAGRNGKWMVQLALQAANTTPQTLTVTGSSQREIHDVLVGEIWLCSGQSNMEMGIGMVQDATNEIAAANFPNIRLLKVPRLWLPKPQVDQDGIWKVCTPDAIIQGGWNGFSAVGYFFGRELYSKLNVPVGLIDASLGGTRIEPWTSPEGFAAVPALNALSIAVQLGDPHSATHKQKLEQFLGESERWLNAARTALTDENVVPTMPVYPQEFLAPHDVQNSTAIYNGMINPIHPFGMRGSIWYQGESNNGDGRLYAEKMKGLVGGWRQIWGEGDFPFYFVQIAPYTYADNPTQVSELWEAQTIAAGEISNAGMIVINDIGDLKNIHPKNKKEVGRGLALLAMARTYDQKDLVYSGPTFESMSIEGSTLRIHFDHTNGGLATRDGHLPNWFEIIDADEGGFVNAEARIDGSSVVLSAPEVHHPVAMRFAWSQLAEPNLMNGAGLPAGAFRSGTVPKRDWIGMHVLEAKDYLLAYDLNLAKLGPEIHWDVDNSSKIQRPLDRIAYCLELEDASGVSRAVICFNGCIHRFPR